LDAAFSFLAVGRVASLSPGAEDESLRFSASDFGIAVRDLGDDILTSIPHYITAELICQEDNTKIRAK
jgi:hypothetical protein